MLVVNRGKIRWACVGAMLCLAGCNGPQQRFMAWRHRDLRTEARTYDFHDPFPDEHAGPETVTRPLSFEDPRTETRQDYDLRLLLSMGGGNSPLVSRRPTRGPLVSPVSPAVPIQPYATTPYGTRR